MSKEIDLLRGKSRDQTGQQCQASGLGNKPLYALFLMANDGSGVGTRAQFYRGNELSKETSGV
jgi:hypothetical protein